MFNVRGQIRMKKSVKYGDRFVDLDFSKNSINISVWQKDTSLPMGYRYIKEINVNTKEPRHEY